jgi:hypothetical protein
MEKLLLSINSGQSQRWTGSGTNAWCATWDNSKIIDIVLQQSGMTIFNSYWVKTSYHVDGVVHHWLNGVLDINMLKALTRFCHLKYQDLVVEEITREHWHCIENGDRFGRVAEHEVWMSLDPPPFQCWEPHLTIYDSRHSELLIEIRKQAKETVRPGFKAVPMGFNFGKRS